MAVGLTERLGTLVADVLDQLRDPGGDRYDPSRIVNRMATAVQLLAQEDTFWRWDVFSPQAEQGIFPLGGLPKGIREVLWNGRRLARGDDRRLVSLLGPDWRSRTGEPAYYFLESRQALRIVPNPRIAGEALQYNWTVTPQTEEAWRGIEAFRHNGTADTESSSFVLWEPGDGQVTNENTAQYLVRVRYTYFPAGVNEASPIDPEHQEALRAFALWSERKSSRRTEDVARATMDKADWDRELFRIGNTVDPSIDFVLDLATECG